MVISADITIRASSPGEIARVGQVLASLVVQKTPEPSREPLTQEQRLAVRAMADKFLEADRVNNATRLKQWLTLRGLERVGDVKQNEVAELTALCEGA